MTEHGEALWERLQGRREENIAIRVKAALDLRDALMVFRAQPLSWSAVEGLLERIEVAAERLAPILPTERGLSLVAASVGLVDRDGKLA